MLDGDNRYRCPADGRLVRATKRITVEEAPNVLAVHLKRFDFFGHGAARARFWILSGAGRPRGGQQQGVKAGFIHWAESTASLPTATSTA